MLLLRLLLLPAVFAFHISIETWRMLPHSYGIVGQQLALNLHRLGTSGLVGLPPDLHVTVFEAPSYRKSWLNSSNLRGKGEELELAGIPATHAESCPDVVFRAYFPLNFAPWPTNAVHSDVLMRECRPLVLTFGTTEYLRAIPEMVADEAFGWDSLARSPNVYLLPPSEWAMEGFFRAGVPKHKMWLLPHGYDPELFRFVSQAVCNDVFYSRMSFLCVFAVLLFVGESTSPLPALGAHPCSIPFLYSCCKRGRFPISRFLRLQAA